MVYNKFLFFLVFSFLLMSSNVFFSKANAGSVVLKRNEIKTNRVSNVEEVYTNLHSANFSLSANTKRLWVIDLDTDTVLMHSLVAHGRNTGDEYANSFSNAPESYKSSLGFYVTGEIYNGKHGKSLKLDGLERGINDNARGRAVVVHGANYVSDSFIQNNKRLGRSLGCPAVPIEVTDKLISTIKDKSCLFIYYPSESYKNSSKLI